MKVNSLRSIGLLGLVVGLPLIGGEDMAGAADRRAKFTGEIHTVLPFDRIPAIFRPEFESADDADVHANSPMIGVSVNGEQHAYSMFMLNHHEIVNDIVGGMPIATTW